MIVWTCIVCAVKSPYTKILDAVKLFAKDEVAAYEELKEYEELFALDAYEELVALDAEVEFKEYDALVEFNEYEEETIFEIYVPSPINEPVKEPENEPVLYDAVNALIEAVKLFIDEVNKLNDSVVVNDAE